MTGRGIDQILPFPNIPVLHERYVKNAVDYVFLAEQKNGLIPRPASFSYIWGDALSVLEQRSPDVRIVNLETGVTISDDYWIGKDIHYRMNPKNIGCLTAAKIDSCCLGNNHVLDWGYSGLTETLETLMQAGIRSSGAGKNSGEAELPAVLELEEKDRVLVFSLGSITSGIPFSWAASKDNPGVNLIDEMSNEAVNYWVPVIKEAKRRGDIVVVSLHWGPNWGYSVSSAQKYFAHDLIDKAGVDVVYGHSSHHIKGIEVYKNKLILYGCGDFLNDYEGINGYESYRSDLCLMYFVSVEPLTGSLSSLEMVPMQIKRFKLNSLSQTDFDLIQQTLEREVTKNRCGIDAIGGTFHLLWNN